MTPPLTNRGELLAMAATGFATGILIAAIYTTVADHWNPFLAHLFLAAVLLAAAVTAAWVARTAWRDERDRRQCRRTQQQLQRLQRTGGRVR